MARSQKVDEIVKAELSFKEVASRLVPGFVLPVIEMIDHRVLDQMCSQISDPSDKDALRAAAQPLLKKPVPLSAHEIRIAEVKRRQIAESSRNRATMRRPASMHMGAR